MNFTLDLPDWVISSVSSVTLPQGETQTVQFAVQPGLEDGVYDDQIKAVKYDGTAADLDIKLIVVPDWQVNPGDYEYSMTVIAKVEVPDAPSGGDVISDDPNDQVAVFVGNELRGVASVEQVALPDTTYLAFLTVYSNHEQGERLRFKVWDDSEGIPYETDVKPLPFVANTLFGDPRGPMTVRAVEDINDLPVVQEIVLNAGWTWFSTLVREVNGVPLKDIPINDALVSLTPDTGDILRSQTADAQFTANNIWENGISLTSGRGYAIQMEKADTLVFEGTRAPFNTKIPLQHGWNWIGFTSSDPIAINDALATLEAKDGDWILSQVGFAQFAGGTWWGSLIELASGEGYRLFMNQPKQTDFTYSEPQDSTPNTKPVLAKAVVPKNAPTWMVDNRAFPHQMAVVAQLNVEGASAIDPNDMVGAFVGDEVRGVAQPVVIPGQETPVAFLMVHGVTDKEAIQFRVFDADRSEILNVVDEIGFEVNKAVGSVASPVVLNARLIRTPDFNADGSVAFADFILFAQMFGKDQDDEVFDGRFDLNDDGSVNFPDFVVFSQAFGQPVSEQMISSAKPVISEPGVNEKSRLSLETKAGASPTEVTLVVRATDATDLLGYGFRVAYDPMALAFVSATSAVTSQFAQGLEPALVVTDQSGELLFADMLDAGVEGEGDLLHLQFQALGNQPGATVELLDAMVSDGVGGLNELVGVRLSDVRPIPWEFGLAQNAPNPFNPVTQIAYQLPEDGDVALVVYNVIGQEVVRLVQERQVAGYYRTSWNGEDAVGRRVSSGVYFYRLAAGKMAQTNKMVLLK